MNDLETTGHSEGRLSGESINAIVVLVEKMSMLSLPEEAKDSIPSVLATCGDLSRSLVLGSSIQRKYSDLENARERAAVLDSQLSRVLNLCLEAVEVTDSVGAVLDLAKDRSVEVHRNPSTVVALWESNCSSLEEQLQCVFTSNLAYEVLGHLDAKLNFRQHYLGKNVVRREIFFPPDHFEAGMTILTNFASIVRSRHGQENASIKIVQDGLKVTLVVDSPMGREEVERTLEAYGDLLSGGSSTGSDLFSTTELISIRQAVEIARVQIDTQNRMLELMQSHIERDERRSRESNETVSRLVDTVQMAFVAQHDHIQWMNAERAASMITVGDLRIVIEEIRRLDLDDPTGDLSALEESLSDGDHGADGESARTEDISRLESYFGSVRERSPRVMRNVAESVAVGAVGQGLLAWLGTFGC